MTYPFITIAWVVFLLFWLANSFTNKRTAERMPAGDRLAYFVLIVLAAVLLFEYDEWGYPLSIALIAHTSASYLISLILVWLGLTLALYARITLGRNWSGSVQIKQGHELVTNGPYAYVRHPIYTAILMMFLGTAIAEGSLSALIALVLAIISCWIKWRQEEMLMTKQFPDQYPGYRSRVKALIPFIF